MKKISILFAMLSISILSGCNYLFGTWQTHVIEQDTYDKYAKKRLLITEVDITSWVLTKKPSVFSDDQDRFIKVSGEINKKPFRIEYKVDNQACLIDMVSIPKNSFVISLTEIYLDDKKHLQEDTEACLARILDSIGEK